MPDLDEISVVIGELRGDMKSVLNRLDEAAENRRRSDENMTRLIYDLQHQHGNLLHRVGLQGEAITRIGGEVRPLKGLAERMVNAEQTIELIPTIDKRVEKIERIIIRGRTIFATLGAAVGVLATTVAFIAEHFGGKIAKWIGLT